MPPNNFEGHKSKIAELKHWQAHRTEKMAEAYDEVMSQLPKGAEVDDVNKALALKIKRVWAKLEAMEIHFKDEAFLENLSPEDQLYQLQDLSEVYANSAEEYEQLLQEIESSIPAYKNTDSFWLLNETAEVHHLKDYSKKLPKQIFEDQTVSLVYEEFDTNLKTLENIVVTSKNLSQESEALKAARRQRKDKIEKLKVSLAEGAKILDDAIYKVAGVSKSTPKKEILAQKIEHAVGEEYEERTQSLEAALGTVDEPSSFDAVAYQEDLERVAGENIDTAGDPGASETEPGVAGVEPGTVDATAPEGTTSPSFGRQRPAFIPPEVASPYSSEEAATENVVNSDRPAFIPPEIELSVSSEPAPATAEMPGGSIFDSAREKRNEIDAHRLEWRELKNALDTAESEFRAKEKEEIVARGERSLLTKAGSAFKTEEQQNSPELKALIAKVRQAKFAYRENILAGVALRREEKIIRVGPPEKEGNSETQKADSERGLLNSFAKRFFVESRQETLKVQQEVTAEQRPQVLKTALLFMQKMEKFAPKNASARKWVIRGAGLMAVSGAAAVAAPVAAGMVAAGAGAHFLARMGVGMAGGFVTNRLYDRYYTKRAGEQLTTTKAENAALMGKATLTAEEFKNAETAYVAAQENLRKSERNKLIATAVGSLGGASLAELGSTLYQSQATAPATAAPETVRRPSLRPLPEGVRDVVRPEGGRNALGGVYHEPGITGVGPAGRVDAIPPVPGQPRNPFSGLPVLAVEPTYGNETAVGTRVEVAPTRPLVEAIPTPRTPEMVTIRTNDTLWRLTEQRYAAEMRGIAPTTRDRILSEIFNEVQADPAARQTLGIRSDRVRLIQPGENLNFSDIHDRLRAKVAAYQLRNELPLPPAFVPPPPEVPATGAVRVDLRMPAATDVRVNLSGTETIVGNRVADAAVEGLRMPREGAVRLNIRPMDEVSVSGTTSAAAESLLTPLSEVPGSGTTSATAESMSTQSSPEVLAEGDVRVNLSLPEEDAVRAEEAPDVSPELETAPSSPEYPPTVPVFEDPGLRRQPSIPAYLAVPPIVAATGRLGISNAGSGEEVVRISRPPVVEVVPPPPPPPVEYPPVVRGVADPRVGQFGRMVETVYGSERNFETARTAMIESVMPDQPSWWEKLLGNNERNIIDMFGDLTPEEFEDLEIPSEEGTLKERLANSYIPLNSYYAWRDAITTMAEQLGARPGVTVNELINHYVLRNSDRYLPRI